MAIEPRAERSLREPHPDRLAIDYPHRGEILAAHDAALDSGVPGYTDPMTDLFVLSAAYLAERGFCCDQGCRHCPYIN